MRPEASNEKFFKDEAAKRGFIQYKFSSGVTGVPDRILIGYGVTAFVELKALDGELSERQKLVISHIRKHGGIVYVPYSKQEILDIFDDITKSTADI